VPNIKMTAEKIAANIVLFMTILRLIWIIKLISELDLDRFEFSSGQFVKTSLSCLY
jgi:hypothetical protein